MLIHVLLYEAGKENEGIHSLEINGTTVVLMFEDQDDAERYCGLLEAQDFPCPVVERLERVEIEAFCNDAGFEARYVARGFLPQTAEDRLLLSPPEASCDVSNWQENIEKSINSDCQDVNNVDFELEQARKKLEDLL